MTKSPWDRVTESEGPKSGRRLTYKFLIKTSSKVTNTIEVDITPILLWVELTYEVLYESLGSKKGVSERERIVHTDF